MKEMDRYLFLGLFLFLFVFIGVPIIDKFFYKIRIAPPEDTITALTFKTKDHKTVHTDAKIFFWGDQNCLSSVLAHATQNVAREMNLEDVMKEEKDLLFFRQKVEPELVRLLNIGCKETEVLGSAFFYQNIKITSQ